MIYSNPETLRKVRVRQFKAWLRNYGFITFEVFCLGIVLGALVGFLIVTNL